MPQATPKSLSANHSMLSLFDSALQASDIAVWQLGAQSRALALSGPIYQLVPELGAIAQEEQLLGLMTPADQYIFQSTFTTMTSETPGRAEEGSFACEVCLEGLASQPRLRFIGRLRTGLDGAREYVGTVVSSQHWLSNPGTEYVQSLLARVFADSPIPSLVTDASGVLLEYNRAVEQLFQLPPGQAVAGVGRYQVLHDRTLRAHPEYLERLQRVYQRGEVQSFELDYPLASLHRNQLFRDQWVPIKVSCIPMRDRYGRVSRVLIQCQDCSGEYSAHRELEQRDQLLYSVINNSRNFVTVKSISGQYLLVNDSFAHWFGRDADEICGLTDAQLFSPDTAGRMLECERKLLAGEVLPPVEEVLAGADGQKHTFVAVRFLIESPNGHRRGIGQIMTDVSRQKSIEQSLQSQRQELRLLLDSMRAAVWYFDRWGLVKDYNQLTQELLSGTLAVGKSFLEVAPQWDDPSERQRELMQVIRTGEPQLNSVESAVVDGERQWFSVDKIPTKNNQGYVSGILMVMNDITARKRYEERLEYQNAHDSLTHLPNRAKLYREMELWLTRQTSQKAALLLIDLDRFKEINDTLGHQVGDRLLCQIGPRLQSEMTELNGTVARLGGDEFAIFLPGIKHSRQALVFGHRVLDALRDGFDIEGYATEISASIGISISPDQANDVSTLMRYSDVAMYCAKTEMTGVALYDPEKDPHSPQRLSMMNELGRGIRDNQLCLYFQPKIDLAGSRCVGCEALLRWEHPELGFVSPADFIPIAEATNLIHPLTRWVLEQSIRTCCDWHEAGYPISVAVNLSARNLVDDTLVRHVEIMLRDYGLPHWALELEITESSIMTDPRRAMTTLERLHELGVTLSIDDFGTGYSSLAYLKRLPVQTLKIDNSFVCQMLEDEQDEIIVNSTIHLAHNLGLSVVAEGVETAAVLERLSDMGCDLAQGYHIARPMPQEAFRRWLTESGWLERGR